MTTGRTAPRLAAPPRDAVWTAIRDLARRGDFTVGEVATRARVPKATAREQMERLARAGVLSKTPGQHLPWPHRNLFTLTVDLGAETPRAGRDGVIDREPTSEDRIWRAIRALGTFGVADVRLVIDGTGTRATGAPAVARYVRHLERAGYLAAISNGASRRRRWRLLPSRNTGPRPPQTRRGASGGRIVYDPNLGRQVWPVVSSTLDRRS